MKDPVELSSVPMMAPIPMYLTCPACNERHIDRGEFATKAHHTHACQRCGLTWRPAIVPTVGVQYLPGFKDSAVDVAAYARVELVSAARAMLASSLDRSRDCHDFNLEIVGRKEYRRLQHAIDCFVNTHPDEMRRLAQGIDGAPSEGK